MYTLIEYSALLDPGNRTRLQDRSRRYDDDVGGGGRIGGLGRDCPKCRSVGGTNSLISLAPFSSHVPFKSIPYL